MSTIDAVSATDAGLVVAIDGSETELSWRWVRDHGEDEASFDPATKQRRIYAISPEPPQRALRAELSIVTNTPVVSVTWPESPEQTWITQSTIARLLDPLSVAPAAESTQPITSGASSNAAARAVRGASWHRPEDTAATKGHVSAVLNDEAARDAWVRDIAAFGFGVLGGFHGSHAEVTELASRIGYPQSTIFGTTWDLASDVDAHDDTAYSQTFLAPHTDGTYSHEAPGLQMFCCTERSGTGGESVIVDGFAVADTLCTEHPADFAVLTSVSVPGHYIEPGVELRTSRPAIRLDEHGNIVQISMNNYDRSPMHLPSAEMDAFYRAYGRLHELANDQSRWMSLRLEAGDVLINDNWRVLHGRRAYTGGRRFVGCYIEHGDLETSMCRLDK